MATVRKGIAEILLDKGLITQEQLAQARDVQKNAPGDLGRILVDLGFATDRDMVQSKAEAEGLPFIDLIKVPAGSKRGQCCAAKHCHQI
jgi:hypothetical protein